MQSRADLHCHTTASDGCLSPAELVRMAAGAGLFAVAITDHDTVSGLEEATEAGRSCGMEVIPGVELSCLHGQKDVHILGLFIDPDNGPLESVMERSRRERGEAALKVVERLRTLGAPVTMDEVQGFAAGETLGRAHFARALLQRGHVSSTREAFDRFIGEGKPAYVHRWRPSIGEACRLIRAAGGVSALAHPGGKPGLLSQEAIARMVEDGLDAIEVHHPAHDERTRSRLERWAASMGLLVTGGSDFHRAGESADLGTCYVGDEQLSLIRARRETRFRANIER